MRDTLFRRAAIAVAVLSTLVIASDNPSCQPQYEEYICEDDYGVEYYTTETIYPTGCEVYSTDTGPTYGNGSYLTSTIGGANPSTSGGYELYPTGGNENHPTTSSGGHEVYPTSGNEYHSTASNGGHEVYPTGSHEYHPTSTGGSYQTSTKTEPYSTPTYASTHPSNNNNGYSSSAQSQQYHQSSYTQSLSLTTITITGSHNQQTTSSAGLYHSSNFSSSSGSAPTSKAPVAGTSYTSSTVSTSNPVQSYTANRAVETRANKVFAVVAAIIATCMVI